MKHGIRYKEFFHMTVTAVVAEINGSIERQQEEYDRIGYSAWLFGIYTSQAIMSTIGNSSWFKKKGTEPNRYPESPYNDKKSEKEREEEFTEEDKIRATEKLFERLSILAANHRIEQAREQKNKENTGSDTKLVE